MPPSMLIVTNGISTWVRCRKQRAGLSLTWGPIDANLLTYLMVGYGIPSVLPPPPEEIRYLLYGSGAGRLGTEGAVSSQLASMNNLCFSGRI